MSTLRLSWVVVAFVAAMTLIPLSAWAEEPADPGFQTPSYEAPQAPPAAPVNAGTGEKDPPKSDPHEFQPAGTYKPVGTPGQPGRSGRPGLRGPQGPVGKVSQVQIDAAIHKYAQLVRQGQPVPANLRKFVDDVYNKHIVVGTDKGRGSRDLVTRWELGIVGARAENYAEKLVGPVKKDVDVLRKAHPELFPVATTSMIVPWWLAIPMWVWWLLGTIVFLLLFRWILCRLVNSAPGLRRGRNPGSFVTAAPAYPNNAGAQTSAPAGTQIPAVS